MALRVASAGQRRVCERNAAHKVDLIQHSRRDLQGLGDKAGLAWLSVGNPSPLPANYQPYVSSDPPVPAAGGMTCHRCVAVY